jgi:hypothetical protein
MLKISCDPRTSAPRTSSNDYEPSPMPPATFDSTGGPQIRPASQVLAFGPPDIWSYDLALAGPNAPPVASGERTDAQDQFSIGETPCQPQASSLSAPITSFNEATATAEHSDIFSIFLDSDPVGSRLGHSETLRQLSSCPSESTNHQRSEGGKLASTSGQAEARRIMSARQELRDAKRDYGIPETRDGSRNTSVERDEDQDPGSAVSARLWDGPGTGPSVPGVLSADEVAELFNT